MCRMVWMKLNSKLMVRGFRVIYPINLHNLSPDDTANCAELEP